VTDRRTSPGATFLAAIGLPAGLGAIAGLLDAGLAVGPGRAADLPLFFGAASLGAALGFAALLPVGLILTGLRFPRRPGGRLAVVLALTLLAPAGLALARFLYKRIPWGAGDLLLGAGAILGILLITTVAGALGSAAPRRREARTVGILARAAVPALLLALPGILGLVSATRPPTPRVTGDAGAANLLLLTVDTLRPDRLGTTGDPRARTPWIDRLARRGAMHVDCLAPSPWTLPSLGSLLTGTYPGEHRVLEELSGLAAGVPTIAEACREDGRRTAAFVSNPWLATGSLARGFDRFDVAERLECLDAVRGTRLAGLLAKAVLRSAGLDRAERLSAQGVAWIERGEGAWFLWVHYFDPHLPNWPGPPWDRLFGPAPSLVGSSLTVEEIRAGDYPGGEEGKREIEALYDGEVAYCDWGIGRLLRPLEASGTLDRTAVVFSADHGEEFWDHADYGHGHAMWDEVVRVPLIVRPPGGATGTLEAGLSRLVDLAPTALAAAGIPPPGDRPFTGVSLAGATGGSATEAPRATYGEAVLYGSEQKFLRAGRWKLVYRPGAPDSLRLFDLVADPAESDDRSAAEPARVDSLRAELGRWMERVGSEGAMAARDVPENLDPTIRDQLEALGYID
jgi:arylsulfatase A-like enzyme